MESCSIVPPPRAATTLIRRRKSPFWKYSRDTPAGGDVWGGYEKTAYYSRVRYVVFPRRPSSSSFRKYVPGRPPRHLPDGAQYPGKSSRIRGGQSSPPERVQHDTTDGAEMIGGTRPMKPSLSFSPFVSETTSRSTVPDDNFRVFSTGYVPSSYRLSADSVVHDEAGKTPVTVKSVAAGFSTDDRFRRFGRPPVVSK